MARNESNVVPSTTVSLPQQFPLACQGAGHAPHRRPGSVRRTTTIDSWWPHGYGHNWEMIGQGRDLVTPFDTSSPTEVARGAFTITASQRREILSIETTPQHPRYQQLVGVRAGGASREMLSTVMGDIRGVPLFQLLDDFAGASLVAGWIWSHWDPNWASRIQERGIIEAAGGKGPTVNICAGFAEGSSALNAEDRPVISGLHRIEVPPLENPGDPIGWHATTPPATNRPCMRRARRIDLWRDGKTIRVDAGFQDSGNVPDGRRVAIHEYHVHAVIDISSMLVLSLQALPLILPFRECPAASINASRMVNQPIDDFRKLVIEKLPGTAGCTHLTDVLRSLADVPHLIKHLPA